MTTVTTKPVDEVVDDQSRLNTHNVHVNPDLIAGIRWLHRQRQSYLRMAFRIDNSTHALVRQALGFQTYDDDKAREKSVKGAQEFVKMVRSGGEGQQRIDAQMRSAAPAIPAIVVHTDLMNAYLKHAKEAEKRMKKLAKQLPVYAWVRDHAKGFGEGMLAQVVGEAGDIGDYRNPSCLWKRFDLHVYKGRAPSAWRRKTFHEGDKALTADEWVEAGSCPSRGAIAYNIATCLVKSVDSPYRTVYLERKAYELERKPDMKPIHAHKRAMRYATKKLLKHLWQAWRAE